VRIPETTRTHVRTCGAGPSAPEELQDPLPRDADDAGDRVEGHPRFASGLDRRSEGLPGFVDIVLGLSGSIDGAA